MTQPDEFWPDTTANADSFSGYAAKTQEEYEDERRGAENSRWGIAGLLGGFFPEPLRSGIQFPLAMIEAIIKRILAPFGGGSTDFDDVTSALTALVQTLTAPLQYIFNLAEWVEELFNQNDSRIAGLEAQINALRVELVPDIDGTGAFDDCKTADNFTEVVGTLSPTGWGALNSPDVCVAHYSTFPLTNRHGAGIRIKSKRIGITRVHICSDDAMTNFVCLELEHPASGSDVARVRTGTSPTDLVTQKAFETRISSETFWEIFYEPYDEDSETSNTFHVFAGGKSILPLRWKDDGNIVTHPEDPTEVGLEPKVGITVNGLDHATRRGWDVTDFTWYDWQAASPA
jgi:hypothetical protein